MTYRHATNLRVPLEPVDRDLLCVLGDYRFGAPVPAEHETAFSLDELRERGFVGLYITPVVLGLHDVRRRTGWGPRVLGKELETL